VRPGDLYGERTVASRQAALAFCSPGSVKSPWPVARPLEQGFLPCGEALAWLRSHPFARRERASLLRDPANASNHRGACLRKAENVDQTWCLDVCGYLSFASKRSMSQGKGHVAGAIEYIRTQGRHCSQASYPRLPRGRGLKKSVVFIGRPTRSAVAPRSAQKSDARWSRSSSPALRSASGFPERVGSSPRIRDTERPNSAGRGRRAARLPFGSPCAPVPGTPHNCPGRMKVPPRWRGSQTVPSTERPKWKR
jgi:hypothetical protein